MKTSVSVKLKLCLHLMTNKIMISEKGGFDLEVPKAQFRIEAKSEVHVSGRFVWPVRRPGSKEICGR